MVESCCVVVVVYVSCWLASERVPDAGCYVIVPSGAAVYHFFVGTAMDHLGSCIGRGCPRNSTGEK